MAEHAASQHQSERLGLDPNLPRPDDGIVAQRGAMIADDAERRAVSPIGLLQQRARHLPVPVWAWTQPRGAGMQNPFHRLLLENLEQALR